ncbi:MAG: hypothetical protein ACREX3_04960, partial [Gammaproteobacteria bacterium]
LIARERGIDEAEVQLPQEGSMEWGRIHDAVAKHNRNQLGLLKEAVGQASSLLAHAIGHPHTRHEMTIHDDRDDTELAQEVRRLPILAQQRLLDVIRASNDLISKGGRLEPVPSGVHETNGDPSD